MKKELEEKEIYKLSYGMFTCFLLAIFSLPFVNRIGNISLLIPGSLLAGALVFAFKLEKIKKNQDVKTYSEILAYMDNREIPNVPEDQRRKTILREKIVFPVIFGAISGLLTYAVMTFFS